VRRGQKTVVGKDEVEEVLQVDGRELRYIQVRLATWPPSQPASHPAT
jgi:hypothetical protein